jgi:hypothetical protein
MKIEDVHVRGNATAEEIAAVIASLHARERPAEDVERFEQWRRVRLAALRDNR